jgi:Eco57I restriction-modification methylase
VIRINRPRVRDALKTFDFSALFIEELGWDRAPAGPVVVVVGGVDYSLRPVAHKRGMVVFLCTAGDDGTIPAHSVRLQIERQATRSAHEHIIVYTDRDKTVQVWQWVKREPGRPAASRQHTFHKDQPGEALVQKLQEISFGLDEEESLNIATVASRAREAFDVERVTRRFFDQFRTEHGVFLNFIAGIESTADREWYASLMLNRLMFVYFIQKKGFLDADTDYLRSRLRAMQLQSGKDQFLSFYRHFLLRLFHEGLGKDRRTSDLDELLGKVPYLNGGLFDVHELEQEYGAIEISDAAFERLFDFFDQYEWHLDERPLRADNEINPDVLGYIFEKYINQKQMGAYYTKEDITEYIARNTVVPYLLDRIGHEYPTIFQQDGEAWNLLHSQPDRYVYEPARSGVDTSLPNQIERGLKDLASRDKWNQAALPTHGLPTETWREYLQRRGRYEELLKYVLDVEHDFTGDELIKQNLDTRQFAQDVIENCSTPQMLLFIYLAVEEISILDPTCGSGAFLFAALNVLEPLYEACLDRMQAFLDELEVGDHEELGVFEAVLARVADHPNRRYFILKSIIIESLYGVDIMEEAVEICKLRLFLKLVSQIELVEDLEPLPDIDFNIRAGNSLVGFATYEDASRSVTSRFDFDDTMGRIATSAADANTAFDTFRELQTASRVESERMAGAKLDLRGRLDLLAKELDQFLGVDFGIDSSDSEALEEWRLNYQPFHWFVEFYGVLKRGGFDVIIGNPPYVEYRNVSAYRIREFRTEACGDLYAYVLERSLVLAADKGRVGFIVPMSCFAVDRFSSLQDLFFEKTSPLFISSWSGDAHPARLFEGVDKRLEIVLARTHGDETPAAMVHSSKYIKWYADERPVLFRIAPVYQALGAAKEIMIFPASVPKIGSDTELDVLRVLRKHKQRVDFLTQVGGTHPLYYTRKVSFFLQFLDFIPKVLDAQGRSREPSELKKLAFRDQDVRDLCLACLTSSLFYWFNIVNSDCRNLNKREIVAFPVPEDVPKASMKNLSKLLREIMQCYQETSTMRTVHYSGRGEVTVQYFNFRPAKPLIDEMDNVLLPLYGLSDYQRDFIVNYELKYRMGQGALTEQASDDPVEEDA